MATTIMLKAESGQWETLGRDRLAGIYAEGLVMTANEHGPDTASFTVKREPSAAWPDLRGYGRCKIQNRGRTVWSGVVWEAPGETGANRQMTIQGRGLQYKLDEDPKNYMAIQTDLGNFKDARTLLTTNLATHKADSTMEISSTGIQFGWPDGGIVKTNDVVSCVLDLGDYYSLEHVELVVTAKGNNGNVWMYAYASDTPGTDSGRAGVFTNLLPAPYVGGIPANTNARVSTSHDAPTAPVRFIILGAWYSGADGTWAADQIFRISRLSIAGTARTHVSRRTSGKSSILRASDIVDETQIPGEGLLGSSVNRPWPNSAKYSDEVLASPECRAAYNLNQSASPFTDYSGNGFNLTTFGSGTAITASVAGFLDNSTEVESSNLAIQFNGGTCLATASLPSFLDRQNDMAMECVFRPNTLPQTSTHKILMYIGSDAASGFGIGIGSNDATGNAGSYLVLLRGGLAFESTGYLLTQGTTYHLVVTRNAHNVNFVYVNGALVYTTAAQTINTPAGAVRVGGGVAGAGSRVPTNLVMDEVSFYSNHLSYGTITFDSGNPGLVNHHYWAALAKKKQSKIDRTLFNIDEFNPDAPLTKRERIEAANAVHSWIYKYDEHDDLVFKARPTAPLLEVGAWSGATFTDASISSVEDMYNWVSLTAPLANWALDRDNPLAAVNPGDPITISRHALQLNGQGLDQTFVLPSGVFFLNDSFTTNTSNWTSNAGSTLTRETGIFDSTPASMSVVASGNRPAQVSTSSGPSPAVLPGFVKGTTYCITAKLTGYTNTPALLMVQVQAYDVITTHYIVVPPRGTWQTFYFPFTAETNIYEGGVSIAFQGLTGSSNFIIDTVGMAGVTTTQLDRLLEVRRKELKVESMLTIATLNQLADTFLTHHKDPPLKGTITVTRDTGVRKLVGGEPIPIHHLLNYIGERIALSTQSDPVTGGTRVGTIVQVEVANDNNSAVITLDNSRTSFEALLARLSMVTGQVR